MNNIIVVIRSAGERTLPLCVSLLRQEVNGDRVHVIHEQPFEAALRACYQLGMASTAEWMITVDADVLPRRGAVRELLDVAQNLPPNVVQVEGLVHDRLLGGLRKAGHRAYRTKLLSLALQAVPPDGTTIRPEFETLETLAQRGYPSQECQVQFGLHDHEQYYRDLYRTGFVHGQKHAHWLADVVPNWRRHLSSDNDLRVALRGFCDGLQALEAARIDVRNYGDSATIALAEMGLTEKEPLEADEISIERIVALQASYISSAPVNGSTVRRLISNYRRLGLLRILPHVAGGLLLAIGGRLRHDRDAQ